MNKIESLEDVLVSELKDLYSAESQLIKALPKAIKAASNENLREALSEHLDETKLQIERLDQIGKLINQKLTGETCEAMKGLVGEASEVLDIETAPNLLDVMIIGACQRMEHYEISVYGTIRAIAAELELPQVIKLLEATLDEEKNADKTLSKIAENEVLCACTEEEAESGLDSVDKKRVRVVPSKKDGSGRSRESDFNR